MSFLVDEGKKRDALMEWFARGFQCFNVLEMTAATAGQWARLLVDLRKKGLMMSIKDSLIAASALEHGLTIATRNIRDFQHSGAPLLNPFEAN